MVLFRPRGDGQPLDGREDLRGLRNDWIVALELAAQIRDCVSLTNREERGARDSRGALCQRDEDRRRRCGLGRSENQFASLLPLPRAGSRIGQRHTPFAREQFFGDANFHTL